MLELTDEDEAKVVEDMLDGFLHRAEKRAHDIAQAAKDESRPPLGDVTAYMQENLKILQKLERDLVRMQQRRGARGGVAAGVYAAQREAKKPAMVPMHSRRHANSPSSVEDAFYNSDFSSD